MYEQKYVNRKKKKIAAAITAGVTGAGITALCIVAFLGQHVGTFTVSLNTGELALALSEHYSFEDQTTFLMVDQLPRFEEYTYSSIVKHADLIDAEGNDNQIGVNVNDKGEPQSLNFFKYTFFVKNVGSKTAAYKLNINVMDNRPSVDGRKLDDTLRVCLFANDGDSTEHERVVYAKKSAVVNYDEEGKATLDEYVSVPLEKANDVYPFMGFATQFETASRIGTIDVKNFEQDQIIRYTLVSWLEGNDPQSRQELGVPQGATIKLGVEINAYENE